MPCGRFRSAASPPKSHQICSGAAAMVEFSERAGHIGGTPIAYITEESGLPTRSVRVALFLLFFHRPQAIPHAVRQAGRSAQSPAPENATVLEVPAAVTVSVPVALPDVTGANST